MLAADLLLRHTRHGSPVRRVMVERFVYPEHRAPEAPGLLLAGVVVAHHAFVEAPLLSRFDDILRDLAAGKPMPQRAMRYRVQIDPIGLDRSDHRLATHHGRPVLEVDEHGPSLPQLVGALVAVDQLRGGRRRTGIELMRQAREVAWTGGAAVAVALLARTDATVIEVDARAPLTKDEEQALATLGFGAGARPNRREVLAAFRQKVRANHPDHGGAVDGAGLRMAALAKARQVLLDAAS